VPKSIAVVGASKDRAKYGNKAVRAFKEGGWTVYPINPSEKEIEGLPCYTSLSAIPGTVDRVAMYVPPSIGKKLLPEIAKLSPAEFFLNPGSEDEELIEQAQKLGLKTVRACSIVNIGLAPDMYPD
jgi:predicted CoA-binding protein